MAKEEVELSDDLHRLRVEKEILQKQYGELRAQRAQLSLDRENSLRAQYVEREKARIQALKAKRAALEEKAKALLQSSRSDPAGSNLSFIALLSRSFLSGNLSICTQMPFH